MPNSVRSRRYSNPPVQDVQNEHAQSAFFPKTNAASAFIQPKREAFFQAKLTIGQPNDAYEQEADKVADAVVNQSQNPTAPSVQKQKIGSIQRLATPDEQKMPATNDARMAEDKLIQEKPDTQRAEIPEEKEPIQAKTESVGGIASNAVASKIGATKGQGTRLPNQTKQQMESAFGRDFSDVNIHTDAASIDLNQQLHAQAFTHGRDIYFNSNKFQPQNTEGSHLLAHELTHVIQQKGNDIQPKIQRTIDGIHDLTSPRMHNNVLFEAIYDNEDTLKFSDSGREVRRLQQMLIDLGYGLPDFGADGEFGAETRTAVRLFQTVKGITVDGVVN